MAMVSANISNFGDMDDATANLILELQLSDINTMQSSSTGKGRKGELTDAELALSLLQQNLEEIHSIMSDRRMTQSIATAVETDGNIVAAATNEEHIAHGDNALAHSLNGRSRIPENKIPAEMLNDHVLSKLAGMFVSEKLGGDLIDQHDSEEICEASSSTSTAKDPVRRSLVRECEACREPKKSFDVISAPCGHEYCRDCLRDLFQTSLTDESLFPPRCCRQYITINSVAIFLTRKLKDEFERKKIEFSTPNRTYCSQPSCSTFIRLEEVHGDSGTCSECGTDTCVICKSEAHAGNCPHDTALHAVLELARENGWQRCYACQGMVELDVGCNHMTYVSSESPSSPNLTHGRCRCGAQFCYVCGAQWRNCGCDQWHEPRLYARANEIVDREPAPRNPAVRDIEVEQAAQMLRERHDCGHANWKCVTGPHQREECHHHLPQYIFECRRCRIQACNRCRRHRL